MHSILFAIFGSTMIVLLAVLDGNAHDPGAGAMQSEFRMDTAVYVGDEQQPSSQNTTLFSDGMVFDFSMTSTDRDPSEITIYDSRNDSFTLLDPKRKIKFVIQQSRLITIVEGLRAETNQNPETRFLTFNDYREAHDIATGWYTLQNDVITYRFKVARPSNAQLVQAYNDFLDKYTLLGATDPRRLPPFPRLRLNRAVQKLGMIPTEIKLSVKETEFLRRSLSLTAKHTLIERLSDSDRALLESAKTNGSHYKQVNMSTYRGLALPTASDNSRNRQK